MKTIIRPKVAELPRLLARLQHSVQFLKVFSLVLLLIVTLLSSLSIGLAFRDPVVIALDPSGNPVAVTGVPDPKAEVETALRSYVSNRFNWDAKTVSKSLADASSFVSSKARKAFDSELQETKRFSEEKSVTSRVYVTNVQVNLEKGVALLTGDRITIIQSIRAASQFRAQLFFESGDRSKENPWGIFITKEVQEAN